MNYEELFSSKFDELLMDEMDRTNCPGTALAIVDKGKLEFTRSYGSSDYELNIPVDPDTLFCVASVTKSFICAAILKLQEQGKLSVHDPISEYLPVTIGYEDDPITIHHLMTHTSGIPNIADEMWYRNREDELEMNISIPRYPFSSWADGFRFLNGAQEFISRPGKRFHYFNFGYGLLSKIITNVAALDFRKYIKQELFEPLGMQRTGFYSQINEDTNLAEPYHSLPGSRTRKFVRLHYDDIRLTRSLDEAAGGLFSSVKELSHYMIMLLNNGIYEGNQVLSQASVALMLQRQFKEEYPNSAFASTYSQKISGYSYGLAIDDDFHSTKLVQHSGSFVGASAWFAFLPEHNRGVIMLSNHHPSPRIFSQAILIESLGLDCQIDWPLLKLRNFHDKLTGNYETYKGLNEITISSEGGQLYLLYHDGSKSALIPREDDIYTLNYYTFTEMGGKLPVQFIEESDDLWLHVERNKWLKNE